MKSFNLRRGLAKIGALSFLSATVTAFPAMVLPARALTVTSSTHPSHVLHDFSTDTVPFTAYAVPGGVPSGARFETQNGALVITNEHAGSFGIDTKIPAFDAGEFGHFIFDYKLSPNVKVNVFFRVKGKYHAAIFSGPPRVRPGGVWLGQIENVQADEQWHRAHVPLRDWLRRLYPLDDELKVEEIIIGNWDNSEFLMAGIGGNGPGAQWRMDNFAIIDDGPREAKLEIKEGNSSPDLNGFQWSLDFQPATPLQDATVTETVENGFHLVRIIEPGGQVVADYPFFARETAPRIGTPRLEGNDVLVPIEISGLQTKGLKLKVGEREFDLSSPLLHWDGVAGVLRLQAAQANLVWNDGERVAVEVDGVVDRYDAALDKSSQNLTVDYSRHQAAPPLPRVFIADSENPIPRDDFEYDLNGWETRGDDGAYVDRDDSTAASGQYSVRLTSPANAATFGAWVRRKGFDAAQYPVVAFKYKASPTVRVNFHLGLRGRQYAVGFTDGPQANRRDNPPRLLGEIEDVKADNQWHRGEFNLLELLKTIKPTPTAFEVEWLALSDAGWLGNHSGAQYWIDDFQLVPAVAEELKARVELQDITGVQAVSWVLDEKPETQAPAKANPQKTITARGEGRRWLHVRAQNGAGQWSETAHFAVVFNKKPEAEDKAEAEAEAETEEEE